MWRQELSIRTGQREGEEYRQTQLELVGFGGGLVWKPNAGEPPAIYEGVPNEDS